MINKTITKFDPQLAIHKSDVLKPLLPVANISAIQPNSEVITSNRGFGNNFQQLGYNNSNENFDRIQRFNHYDLTQKEINNDTEKTHVIIPNEQLSTWRQSPVEESFSNDALDFEAKNKSLQNELYAKIKHIEALQNELKSMSQLYSDENLRQLEQMNRLIAVIIEEKNESTAKLESKIREQHDTMRSLCKKLDAKDSMIKTLEGENIFLHKRLNMKKIKNPTEDFSCCVLKDNIGPNDVCQVASKGEEQCHHRNARRISPVEPWRKVYVQDAIVKDGRTWYWCPKHKMPDYNGLYVTHHPNDHDKWADKVAENKRTKTMKKKNPTMLLS